MNVVREHLSTVQVVSRPVHVNCNNLEFAMNRIRIVLGALLAALVLGGLTPSVAQAGIGKMDGRGADYQAYSRLYDSVINMSTRGDAIAGIFSLGGPEFRWVAGEVGQMMNNPRATRECKFTAYKRALEMLNTAYGNGRSVRNFGKWAGKAAGFVAKRLTGSGVAKQVVSRTVTGLFNETAALGVGIYNRGQARANLAELAWCL
jgi:hypothetical protein